MDWTNIAYTGIGFLFGQISMVGALWGKRLVGQDAIVRTEPSGSHRISPPRDETGQNGSDTAHARAREPQGDFAKDES
jgi:hypothetical protein